MSFGIRRQIRRAVAEQPPRDGKALTRKRFGDVAANYRTSAAHAAGRDLDLMIQAATRAPDALALDAGCGAGHAAVAFAAVAGTVIACDFTPAMLRQVEMLAAERGAANVVPQLADVESLPFAGKCFDLIVTRYSAHHWRHPERALAEFKRVLNPEGALLISDIMAAEDYSLDTFLQTIELLRDPSHARDYRISEWLAMLAKAGFKADVLLRFELTLHFKTWTRRMATPTPNAEMIKMLFEGAPDDIKRAFRLPAKIASDDFNFVIPGAVIRATVPPD